MVWRLRRDRDVKPIPEPNPEPIILGPFAETTGLSLSVKTCPAWIGQWLK